MRVTGPGWIEAVGRVLGKGGFDRVFRHYAVQLVPSSLPPRASITSHQRD